MTEDLSRELIGNLILAATLASRGHVAIVLNQEDQFILSAKSLAGPTIFHTKSVHSSERKIREHQRLKKLGFFLTAQDQECFLGIRDLGSRVSERISFENLNLFDRFYAWGPADAAEISRQYPSMAEKIKPFGSPREDSWGPRFRRLRSCSESGRKRVVFTPSVRANNPLRHWELMDNRKTITGSSAGLEFFVDDYCDGIRSQLFFSRLAIRLAEALPDCDIIVQPKNSEVLDSWQKSVSAVSEVSIQRKNLLIQNSSILEETIHSAHLVVNSSSTAGITAFIGEIPLISIGPTTSIASELGAQVGDVDSAVALARVALDEPKKFIEGYQDQGLNLFRDRVLWQRGHLAAEAIVRDMELLVSDSGHANIAPTDFLLYFSPGGIRRAGSFLKSVLTFRPRQRASPEKVQKLTNRRLENLVTRILQSMDLDQDFKVSVAGRRNVIFRPVAIRTVRGSSADGAGKSGTRASKKK